MPEPKEIENRVHLDLHVSAGLDGATARGKIHTDGIEWRCSDYNTDGIHPSATGRQKVPQLLLRFFKHDATTGWFLA